MESKVQINYSHDAELLISHFKDFSRADFESWFLAHLPAGSKNVMDYLLFKEREKKDKEKLEKEK